MRIIMHNISNFVYSVNYWRFMSDSDKTRDQIIAVAVEVIIRLGYDKTTMSDIAEEAGLSRRTIYLYFMGKDDLFEELLCREYLQYAQTWLELIDADPRGGTIGGFYRANFHAVNSRPLIAAMLRRDRRVIGNYLRKRDNIFTQMLSGVNTLAFFLALQAAGAIRQDIDAAVIEHILEMLSYGQLTIGDFKPADQFPPNDAVMEALTDIMDRALRPAQRDGAPGADNSEAGKVIVQQITEAARAQMEQIKQAKDMKEKIRKGATHDNR